MSALKVFTVRALDREPSAVLDECDRSGGVTIRRRDGRTYTLRRDMAAGPITKTPNIIARLEKLIPKAIPENQTRLVDKLLAGE